MKPAPRATATGAPRMKPRASIPTTRSMSAGARPVDDVAQGGAGDLGEHPDAELAAGEHGVHGTVHRLGVDQPHQQAGSSGGGKGGRIRVDHDGDRAHSMTSSSPCWSTSP